MVVPIRELANTLFPSTTKHLSSTSMAQNPSNMDMDMDTDILRGRSVSSSNNSSRESSMHSNASLVPYHKKMEIQSNNPLWSEQMKIEENERFSLSYAMPTKSRDSPVKLAIDNSPKERDQCEINMAPALDNTPAPHQDKSKAITNTNTLRSSRTSHYHITYVNQLNQMCGMVKPTPFPFIALWNF